MNELSQLSAAAALPAPRALPRILRDAALLAPQAIALETPDESLTYAALLDRTQALSARLTALGLAPGDRIGIAATRSATTIVAILASIDAGLGYVPLDLAYPGDRLQAMLEDARPRVVLGDAPALAELARVAGTFPTMESPAPASAAVHAATPDLAYVLFTSGSTGRPKGVAMGAKPLAHLIDWHAAHPRLGRAARTLLFAPLSFDVHFQEIFSTLACGGTLVMVPEGVRRDPAQLHRALVTQRIARIFLPYVALQMIAQAAGDEPPASLADVVSAGEQLQVTPAIRRLFAQLPGAALHNHYGPTESHVVTAFELEGDAAAWPEIPPIGRALPHVVLALRDADTGAVITGTGATGELLIGGETLAAGYLGQPLLTSERFQSDVAGLPGRWYRSGDLVQTGDGGVLTYLGRADQQLKVDGFRIEPGEIELALMAHVAVRDAVVTAPDVPGIGKQLVAHLVLNDTHAESGVTPQLRAHLRASLPEYMVPVRFIVLKALPTTPSGKIDRRGLPLPALAATPSTAANDLPALCKALWQNLLGLDTLGDNQNLFELGARSLMVLRFVSQLKEAGVAHIGVADVYDRPTLAGIAAAGTRSARRRRSPGAAANTEGIAIVGMATRTPGAADVEGFWQNLLAGREGIRHFAPHELDASVPESLRSRPNFVAARGVLEDADRFDAGFFGLSAREAAVTDPQQRLMLELAWTALEHAAIDPSSHGDQRIGVYAGTANNNYVTALRAEDPDLVQRYGEFATMLASEKDYVATRVAHRLNLNGPALSIHTACSTGLVAVAQAWHGLASGQCDVAIAGGSTVNVPQHTGYLHVEGGMESADGHCRPFDAQASGTVFASGGAVVVLKRLEDALADGDTVFAVIRGVGLNNDGGDKASFTAPSVTGQSEAIRMALEHAGVNARSIGYVEAHGTGTSLGDPIEVAALTRAYREDTADAQFCGLGSLKGNLGHMVAAAGVAGLIKSALSLHHGVIPATLHYRQPNPQIDFGASPFSVVATNTPWPRTEAQPRRAAVSSFGVGGTNAHVVLEEAPLRASATAQVSQRLVLPLSARDNDAVLARARLLADHLAAHPDVPLADVAATLVRGRKPMGQRQAIVAATVAEAVTALRAVKTSVTSIASPRVVFLFPGQGSQHPGMARQLCDEAPAFREAFDRAMAIAQQALGVDLRRWLVEADPADESIAARLAETHHAQPALFAVSYGLAAWLDSLGVTPHAMIGHSIGEYAAACHAGVMTLDEATAAVVARGRAMFVQPRGAMLAVRTDAATLQPLLPAGIEIAGNNAPALTVVAGSADAIDALTSQLEARDIGTTRLRVSHAFHSASMDGALPKVAEALKHAALKAPRHTVYSCVTGAPLTAEQATDPAYWAGQVRATVQFTRAVSAELTHGENTVFIEVGPGQALTALLRQHRTPNGAVPRQVPLLGAANKPGEPAANALHAVGQLWALGVPLAWPVAASAPRVPLPTYPFKDERHWFKRQQPSSSVAASALTSVAAVVSSSIASDAVMDRLPLLETELKRILSDVSGVPADDIDRAATFVDQGLDSLSLTQATLELERVFGVKLRFRRLLEDLNDIDKLARFLDAELPADKFAPAPAAAPASAPVAAAAVPAMPLAAVQQAVTYAPMAGTAVQQLIQQQMQLMSQQLAVLAGQPVQVSAVPMLAAATAAPALSSPATPTAAAPAVAEAPARQSLVDKPFGASPRLTLEATRTFTAAQQRWLDDFIARYNARSGKSKAFSQANRKLMADPRVVTGFNPLWKDLVYPIVVDRSSGATLQDIDGNSYIDLLSGFGANLLGYQPASVTAAMAEQLQRGIEVGPQHPLAADVAQLMSDITGMQRIGFCNTGSEAVMGAMRIARTVTGRKTIAIFTNSYHGIFDEVIVRGTKQLRSLSAAPGILANAVENILVLDWNSEDSLRVLRERGNELAAIMTEPIQNKYPTIQPREFVRSLRDIADKAGCALIFDEVVTGFRVAPGGAQEFYGVRADIATYGKIIGGGLPFAAIAGADRWLDALDGGHWQYGDDSYPEAGVTYFAGTFVRHPLALAAARATLQHLKTGGAALYKTLNDRTTRLIERLNTAFAVRGAPVEAVHCASLWRLSWDDNQKFVSLFYYLARFHGLHLYEQFGHFVTEGMSDADTDRIFTVFTDALDELMALGFITPRDGGPAPKPRGTSDKAAEAALTPGQTERWLAGSFDANARRALNESFCVSLQGDVNRPALKAALHDVLSRHDAFRVQFSLEDPIQRLGAATPLAVAELDLREQADADAALDAFCSQASLRDFPVDNAPLAAVSLLDLADGRTVVHVVASHLVFDGWASSVFNAELADAYKARAAGAAPSFPAAESPLAFGAAEQARFDSPEGKEALAFWTGVLAGAPAPLSIGDRTPGDDRSFAADTVRVRLDGDALARLRAQAKRASSTLFQLLLTAVTVVLHRRSGKEDFVVSIPYASQSLQRHGPLMADGVLDLPLRLHCAASDDVTAVLKRVRSHLMDALDHPLMTQGTVARALGIRSVGSRPPLTGIYFNLNPRVDLSAYAPLAASMHEGRKRATLSELFFNFYENGDALTLDLHHSSEFFSRDLAQQLVDELMDQCRTWADALAGTAGSAPERIGPVADPRLLAWNATSVPIASNSRIEQWVARQAAATPDAPALVALGATLTYRELEARANRFAHVLRARGAGVGSLVGVCLTRVPDLVPALLGVLKTGAAYVPLDPGFPKDRLAYMAEDAALHTVITDAARAHLAGLPREQQLRIDEDAAVLSAAPVDAVTAPATSQDDPAYVIYTSGSTGKPKGVVLPQQAVCNFLASMRREPGLKSTDRLLAVTTLSFDIAVLELFLPLTTGACVVLAQREDAMDAEALAALIGEQRINVMQATPTTWHLLLDAGWQAPRGFKALCGGEPLPPSLAARLLTAGVELWNMYGPTETTVWSTLSQVTDAAQRITIGRPIDNTQVWVLDEQMKPCAIGAEGEICIGGDGVAIGYFKRPELTADRFVRDPFSIKPGARLYRTGDLGRWGDDGQLHHLGRLDFQVKVRGYRIELGEIEARLETQPGVARSVVVAREDSPGDVRLVAYLVAAPGARPEAAALRQALKAGLPDYMVPQHVVVLDAMPLLPNGKIDRKSLPQPGAIHPPTHAPAAAAEPVPAPPLPTASPATTALHPQVAAAMADVLGVASVAAADNFFELGGHSLQAAKLASRLSALVGQRVSLRTLFAHPTPASLAQALTALGAQPVVVAARVMPHPARDEAPLSLMQQRLWFLEEMSPGTPFNQLPSGHRFRGPFNEAAFRSAFAGMVERQPSMRTVIAHTADGALQRVLPSVALPLGTVEDMQHLPATERDAAVRARIHELTLEPVDLEAGPLFRAHLFRLAADEHVLFFMVHHLVWDGASFDVMYRDMSELYAAAVERRAPTLAPLAVTYGDFAHWQREWLNGPELARQVDHWKATLTPLPETLDLQGDRNRPPRITGDGASCLKLLPASLVASLHRTARAHGVTLSTLLLAAYGVQLQRLSGKQDFAVATPVRGREQPELEAVTGFFVNAVPLRLRPDPSSSFDAWMNEVQQVVAAAFACPDVPFEHLVQALGIVRDPARHPLAEALYSFQDVRERPVRWGPIDHTRFDIDLLGSSHDLSLYCVELSAGLELALTYNSDIFSREIPERFLSELAQLLESIATAPTASLGALTAPAPARPVAATVAPDASDLATDIAASWKALIGVDHVGPDDNFFDLGGHSILAMRAALAVEQRVGKRVKVRMLFDNPTPRRLAQAAGGQATPSSPVAGSAPIAGGTVSDIPARADQQFAPLSLMQQRLWFLESATPGTPFNQLPSAQRLSGPFDAEAFARAFQRIVDRQAALRTVIERTPDGVRQRVLPQSAIALPPVEDVRAMAPSEREAFVTRRIRELAQAPFDFERAPPYRVHLFRLADNEHVMLFVVHHFIWDGTSFDLLARELASEYAAEVAGTKPEQVALPVSYGDFAAWQNDAIDGAAMAEQIAHWRAELTPLPEPLELPGDRPRPARMSGRGGSASRAMPGTVVTSLLETARAHGVTLSTLMLSAYALQLSLMSGQDDLVVAMPVQGRDHAGLDHVMGFFANALPLRLKPTGGQAFAQWLTTVQGRVGAAFSHPDTPFEHLVRALDVPRDGSRPLLAQVLYTFLDQRDRPAAWGGVVPSTFGIPMVGTTHDISLYCFQQSDQIELGLTYNADVFDEGTAEQFLERFEHLLAQASAKPSMQLGDFSLATPSDSERLRAWNATDVPFDQATTVHGSIAATAARVASAIAIVQPGLGRVSHGELDARANRLARVLRARGIGRGALVGLCVDRSIEMVVAQLAILKAGAAYVPLDPAYPSDRLAHMVEDAKLALLVSESGLVHTIDWPRSQTVLIDIDAAAIASQPATALEVDAERDARPLDAAYVIYTSGSTGKPKGVVVPHRAVVNFLDSMAREPGLAAGDRLVAVTTLSFDIAVLELLLPLYVGAEIVLASRDTVIDGPALRSLVESTSANVLQATPSTWRMLIESGWQGSPSFKALIGGEGLPYDLAVQLIERTGALWNMYGPTETTVWSTCCRVEHPERGITIGRPIANTQVHVLNQQLSACAIGVPGEVFIAGDGVTLGYLHRAELTAERFIDNPFEPGTKMYRTGDRGRWRHDGQLEHMGRLDFQVKVRGYRIELGEIESNLAAHPQVARALVIVREDQPGDMRLVAYVVGRGTAPSADALREHLRATLPEYMLPQHVLFLDAIPLLPNGKTDRHALPAPSAESSAASQRQLVAARTPNEAALVEIWKSLLNTDQVGVTDNFFDLGGHSLLAMRAVIEMEKVLGVRINVRRMIFETLTQLAGDTAETPVATSPAVAIDAVSARPAQAIDTPRVPPKGLWGRLMGALRNGSDRAAP